MIQQYTKIVATEVTDSHVTLKVQPEGTEYGYNQITITVTPKKSGVFLHFSGLSLRMVKAADRFGANQFELAYVDQPSWPTVPILTTHERNKATAGLLANAGRTLRKVPRGSRRSGRGSAPQDEHSTRQVLHRKHMATGKGRKVDNRSRPVQKRARRQDQQKQPVICRKHPTYKALRRPTANCMTCLKAWLNRATALP